MGTIAPPTANTGMFRDLVTKVPKMLKGPVPSGMGYGLAGAGTLFAAADILAKSSFAPKYVTPQDQKLPETNIARYCPFNGKH